jgi:hypothetical protein
MAGVAAMASLPMARLRSMLGPSGESISCMISAGTALVPPLTAVSARGVFPASAPVTGAARRFARYGRARPGRRPPTSRISLCQAGADPRSAADRVGACTGSAWRG